MITFEETQTMTFTQEQARIHYFALKTHIKRMERALEHHDYKIAEFQQAGDLPMALKEMNKKQRRLNYLFNTQKELNRMCEIFGDLENGTGEN